MKRLCSTTLSEISERSELISEGMQSIKRKRISERSELISDVMRVRQELALERMCLIEKQTKCEAFSEKALYNDPFRDQRTE